jgi:hypothetical protein
MRNFGKLDLSLGMDKVAGGQELWRFLDLKKAQDLFCKRALYLRRVALLRDMDERESRLPDVIHKRLLQASRSNQKAQRFIENFLTVSENQADSVYASWYLPDESEDYQHMWKDFGGGKEGGVCVVTTVERLGQALVEDGLSIGLIRYIEPDITFEEAFALTPSSRLSKPAGGSAFRSASIWVLSFRA